MASAKTSKDDNNNNGMSASTEDRTLDLQFTRLTLYHWAIKAAPLRLFHIHNFNNSRFIYFIQITGSWSLRMYIQRLNDPFPIHWRICTSLLVSNAFHHTWATRNDNIWWCVGCSVLSWVDWWPVWLSNGNFFMGKGKGIHWVWTWVASIFVDFLLFLVNLCNLAWWVTSECAHIFSIFGFKHVQHGRWVRIEWLQKTIYWVCTPWLIFCWFADWFVWYSSPSFCTIFFFSSWYSSNFRVKPFF